MGMKNALNSYRSDGTDADSISWASQGTLDDDLMQNVLGTAEEKTKTAGKITAKWYLVSAPTRYEEIYLEMLFGAVQALSSDYETQASLLPPGSDKPDKLLSIFENCYVLVEVIGIAGILDKGTVLRIKRLYFMLTRLSHEPDQWTVEAMKNSPEWNAVRALAKQVLGTTGGEISKPELDWPKYG